MQPKVGLHVLVFEHWRLEVVSVRYHRFTLCSADYLPPQSHPNPSWPLGFWTGRPDRL